MNYEKKYKNALANARQEYNTTENLERKQWLEELFPELTESEDEKIKQKIIKLIKKSNEVGGYALHKWEADEMLAWLEKQETKELAPRYEDIEELLAADDIYQMSMNDAMTNEAKEKAAKALSELSIGKLLGFEKQGEQEEHQVYETKDGEIITYSETDGYKVVEPKFKVGDWITNGDCKYQIASIEDCMYYDANYCGSDIESTDKNYHLWTIADAKDGDVLFSDLMCGKTFIYNGVNSDMAILYSFIISNDGDDVLPYHIGKPNTGIGTIEDNKNIIHPATKEQRDYLFAKMREAGYEWDEEKKEVKKIKKQGEQKETLCDKCKKAQYSHSCQDIIALGRCYIEGINISNTVEPKWSDDENSKVNDETNAPTGYGKYVNECLNEASKHFFSDGEDKYSVADLFYAGVRCGKSWLEKECEQKTTDDPVEQIPNSKY